MNILTTTPSNVKIIECNSLDEAQQKASSEGVNTSGTTILAYYSSKVEDFVFLELYQWP